MPDTGFISKTTFLIFIVLTVILAAVSVLPAVAKNLARKKLPIKTVTATFLSASLVEKTTLPSKADKMPDRFRLTFWVEAEDKVLEFFVARDPKDFMAPGEDVALTYQGDRFVKADKLHSNNGQ